MRPAPGSPSPQDPSCRDQVLGSALTRRPTRHLHRGDPSTHRVLRTRSRAASCRRHDHNSSPATSCRRYGTKYSTWQGLILAAGVSTLAVCWTRRSRRAEAREVVPGSPRGGAGSDCGSLGCTLLFITKCSIPIRSPWSLFGDHMYTNSKGAPWSPGSLFFFAHDSRFIHDDRSRGMWAAFI